jgi:hypothetical protein
MSRRRSLKIVARERLMTEEPKILDVRPLTTTDYVNMLVRQSEAGSALVLAGLVEDWLQKLLLQAGRPLSNALAMKIFDGMGPLSQFAAKIEVAYLFELVDEITYNDLLAIKEIRNRFAHTIRFVNFSSEEIKKACQRLTGWHREIDRQELYLSRTKECVDKMSARIERDMFVNALREKPET